MRRSARIASLYGTEWSNLPSVRQAQKAKAERMRDMTVLTQLLEKYDNNAPLFPRSVIILRMLEYLAVRPSILHYHAGIRQTTERKIQEFKRALAAHQKEMAEYRAAVVKMHSALSGPLLNKGIEIMAEGMKSREEQAQVWNRLESAIARVEGAF